MVEEIKDLLTTAENRTFEQYGGTVGINLSLAEFQRLVYLISQLIKH